MASLSAGVKALIVASGVAADRVYQDEAPSGVTYPYVVFHDFIADTPALRGDGSDDIARRRVLQADLYFATQASDSKTTVDTLREALAGARVGSGDEGTGFRLLVENVQRAFWHDADDVRYVLDLRLAYLD